MAGSLPLTQPSLEMANELATTHVLQVRTVQLSLEMDPKTMHIHLTHLVGVRGGAESQVFWCNAHNVQVGIRMAKLVVLQLV